VITPYPDVCQPPIRWTETRLWYEDGWAQIRTYEVKQIRWNEFRSTEENVVLREAGLDLAA